MSRTTHSLLIIALLLTAGMNMPEIADAAAISDECGRESTIARCLGIIGTDIATSGGLSTATDAPSLLATIINWLLSLVALLAMVALIWGGIMYIISLGDESRAQTAKKIILYAITGLIVVIISFVIITTVQQFLAPSAKESMLPAINTAHAAETGLNAGIEKIKESVATDTSGLADGDTRIYTVIERVAFFLLGLTSIIALVALIVSGFMYILSIGDEGRAEKAKKVILYAIIGLIIVLVSFTIIAVVREALTGLAADAASETTLCDGTETGGFRDGFECTRDTATAGGISFVGPRATILTIIKTVLNLVAIIALAVVIWAGVSYVISLGNEDKVKKAKMMLLYAIIGLVIIGVAIIVVNFVINLFITA